MPRNQHLQATNTGIQPSLPSKNLDYCGFECPSCGYQHRLSDCLSNGIPLIDKFRSDALAHAVICPECGTSTDFARSNLKLFRGRGEG